MIGQRVDYRLTWINVNRRRSGLRRSEIRKCEGKGNDEGLRESCRVDDWNVGCCRYGIEQANYSALKLVWEVTLRTAQFNFQRILKDF